MEICEISKKIEKAGGKIYLVGGAVRDKLMNRVCQDKDYCVVGLSEEEFINIFPNANIRGKSFKVFDIEGNEIALARKEQKNGKGHKEFEIITDKNIKIEEDLFRRDVTINSIAQEIKTGKLIDPFNGRNDIKNRILRATSDKFSEDPLRVYRVARFAAIYEFSVEDDTIEKMNKMKEDMENLSSERVYNELKKALSAKKPSIFFNILRKADVLDVHFKEISNLIGVLQPVEYNPEGDAYEHTMLVLDRVSKVTDNIEVKFCALVHDLGKALTPKEEYPHHYNHEKNGVYMVEQLGKKLKLPNAWVKSGKISCLEHMRGGIFYKMRPEKKIQFIERVSKTKLGLKGLQIIVNADKSCNPKNIDEINNNNDFYKIGERCLNEITGKQIVEKFSNINGKNIGIKLHQERIKWIKENY